MDASESHVGVVLQQKWEGQLRPLAFFSFKLDNTQRKYSAFDRELLAVCLGIRHFRWQFEECVFHMLTDQKPLTFALHHITDACSARQQRQLSYIAEFTSDMRHVAGKTNVVIDALLRPAAAVTVPTSQRVDYVAMAAEQQTCGETAAQLRTSPALQIQEMTVAGTQLWCNVSTGVLQPLVPCSHTEEDSF